jgi:hypothetical protein
MSETPFMYLNWRAQEDLASFEWDDELELSGALYGWSGSRHVQIDEAVPNAALRAATGASSPRATHGISGSASEQTNHARSGC